MKRSLHKNNSFTPRTFQLVCHSDPKEVMKVEGFLKKMNKVVKLDDGTFYRLLVATTEAVNNGIIHGNKSNAEKLVTVLCIVKPQMLIVKVEDEGRGFNPDKVPNPLDEEHLLKESGRGIFLMKSMMDKVRFKFTKHGTLVEMSINLKRLQ